MSTLQTRKRAESPSHCLEVSRLTGGADTGPGVPDVRCPPQLCQPMLSLWKEREARKRKRAHDANAGLVTKQGA